MTIIQMYSVMNITKQEKRDYRELGSTRSVTARESFDFPLLNWNCISLEEFKPKLLKIHHNLFHHKLTPFCWNQNPQTHICKLQRYTQTSTGRCINESKRVFRKKKKKREQER
jgi:hypothetical protein